MQGQIEKQKHKAIDTDKDINRETELQRQTDRQIRCLKLYYKLYFSYQGEDNTSRGRETETDRGRQRDREKQIHRQRERQTGKDIETETEIYGYRQKKGE